ncbi:probable G-protein coupled receptor Mth-like 14 [Armigeres subalbatus]|uniref:probable G-protein coupled receptor Mth-like 14 n=1 Tax=Armigeres subalbatus TaxID=124917 RepID=UPI002ED1875D
MHSRGRIKPLAKIFVLIVFVFDGSVSVGLDPPNSTFVADGIGNATGSSILPNVTSSSVGSLTEKPALVTTTVITTTTSTEEITTERVMTTTASITTASQSSTRKEVLIESTTAIPAPDVSIPASHDQLPNCSEFEVSPHQPLYDKDSHIKKCCPHGEIFEDIGGGRLRCTPGERKLDIETIYAVFYGDAECIEDKEHKIHFDYEPSNACYANNLTFQYSKDQGDEMFVIQNGSLLVVAQGQFMAVFDNYCVEVDVRGKLLAKACDEVEPIVLRSTAVLIYVGLAIASIGLVLTSVAYAFVPKLNDVFGYLLVSHAGSFLVGMILISLAVCGDRCVQGGDTLEIFGHVFLITAVYAFVLMNVHNYVYSAYYLPNGLEFDTKNKSDVFFFLAVSYTITIIPMFLPWKNALIFHIVLYIFYAVIAVVLYLSHRAIRTLANSKFIRFTVSHQNYQELTYTEAVNAQPRINQERLDEVRGTNRLCTIEAIYTIICWVVLSLMEQQLDSQYDIFRLGAAFAVIFQGMLIGVLFVGGSQKWTIIRECWSNSGSIDLHALETEREMRTMERKAVIES